MHYIYLVRPKDFCHDNVNIYKIGKMRQNKVYNRLSQYNGNSDIIMIIPVIDVDHIETIIKYIFKRTFRIYKGTEYFIGDVAKMIFIILEQVHIEQQNLNMNINSYCEAMNKNSSIDTSDTRIFSNQLPIKISELEMFINETEYNLCHINDITYKELLTSFLFLFFLCKNYYDIIQNIITYHNQEDIICLYDNKIKDYMNLINTIFINNFDNIKEIFLEDQAVLMTRFSNQIKLIKENYYNITGDIHL